MGEQLAAHYPLPLPGCHRVRLDNGRVTLSLVWGDAARQLALLDAENGQMDAWFLDGFSPRSNPDIWSDQVLLQVARLTRQGGSFSTFSVAGSVRRGLTRAGFDWHKQPGYGQKGEMLVGLLRRPPDRRETTPWFKWPPAQSGRRVAIIGGGIAGLTTAYALAEKQFDVCLVERSDALAHGGSGNAGGVMSPFLTADHGLASRFSCAAFAESLQLIRKLHSPSAQAGHPDWFHAVGELRLAVTDRDRQRQQSLIESGRFPPELVNAVTAGQASQLAGVEITHAGLHLPAAGWVEPVAWIAALHRAIGDRLQLLLATRVAGIHSPDGSSWRLIGDDGGQLLEVDHLILANAQDATRLLPSAELAIRSMRGQVGCVPATGVSRRLKAAISFGHYLLPEKAGTHLLGASYAIGDDTELDEEHHLAMTRRVQSVLPGLLPTKATTPAGRVAWRATTPDRLPLVGPVSTAETCRSRYAELHLGRSADTYPLAQSMANLYLNTGHGSRGLVSATLSAELLACHIAGQLSPVDREVKAALHPDRFHLRGLRRR